MGSKYSAQAEWVAEIGKTGVHKDDKPYKQFNSWESAPM